MVPVSRSIFFAAKQAARQQQQALSLFRRFGPSRNPQSRSFHRSSTKPGHEKRETHDMYPMEEEPQPGTGSAFLFLVGIGMAGVAALLRYNDKRRAIPSGKQQKNTFTPGPVIGGPFSLIDTEKRVFTERDFLGNWVLLYFGYTSSPDLSPEQVKTMAKAVDKIESKKYSFVRDPVPKEKLLPVFVTIDPQRDTPSHLRAYLREFDPRIVGLTGPDAAVRQMAWQYRVFFRKVEEEKDDYLVESNHNFYLISPEMEVVKCFGPEYNAERLTEAIQWEIQRKSWEKK